MFVEHRQRQGVSRFVCPGVESLHEVRYRRTSHLSVALSVSFWILE